MRILLFWVFSKKIPEFPVDENHTFLQKFCQFFVKCLNGNKLRRFTAKNGETLAGRTCREKDARQYADDNFFFFNYLV